jgi:transposase
MKTKRVWAGIDVSKAELAVGFWPQGQAAAYPRDEAGIGQLAGELKRLRVRLVVLEATGGLELPVVLALARAGVPVHRCEPARARHFAKALGVRAKTDPVDALMLARFAASGELKPQTFASAEVRQLDALVTRRRQVVKMITEERNRLHASADKACRASIRQLLRALVQHKRKIEAQIAQALDRMPELKAKSDLLQSAPGVGKVVAATLAGALPELGSLDRWQAAALTGTAPFHNRSGRYQGKSRISGGRADVRCALYMAAHSARKHDPGLAKLYDQLVAHGKPKKVALTACMRHLVVALNAMLRDNTPWRQTAPAAIA